MIRTRLYRDGRATDEDGPLDDAVGRTDEERVFVWVDVEEPTAEDLGALSDVLGLHPLIADDIAERRQRPRVERVGDHIFIVLRAGSADPDDDRSELQGIVGRRYLVTIHAPNVSVEPSAARWERQPELLDAAFAAYVLLDDTVGGYLSAIDRLEDRVDEAEDRVFSEESGAADPGLQRELFDLKRQAVHLRRAVSPLREGVELLQSLPSAASSEVAPYLRDVMGHVIRVVELADGIRDVVTSLLEVRVAQAANRMNDAMKKMSAWAGIVLVPTLIAGIYGMNFREMPELGWGLGYPFALALMAGSALGLYLVFRRRGWL